MPLNIIKSMLGFFFQDVESLMEKHSVLEKDFLKEKEQEAISFQDRYKELQVNPMNLKFNMWAFLWKHVI